ncbi:Ferredoxin--NADP reductase [Roseomonas mucosa]|uniref:ferredoxin--NADP(+) reductase n=1 Tax=Roseomonas mucosa TaxID=207340 RepID=A0A379N0K2_9PROT|nr:MULTISPECIES: ferredoxin--NADP reductase [Roseomonas]MBS5902063.1 ferredoxin--NADP reductase [Acetobacteraceae bacterium]MCG7352319.1 ferredoxin--NADP reductase [Roseomonas mucosa]MCG7357383.1 ferredoxin--NADP reductase [Roseomonas mucosa]MDT8288646.1 ferredoxin--NADP reductase [Roseomonas mucosa]MDT8292696.1 ferredoxin--NADP reductase [Roseomonas mucosa]
MNAPAPNAAFFHETVLSVHHWTDQLFSFRTTRDQGLRFQAGQFVMIGLMVEGRPLLRAYSIASAPWDEELDFLSIKVPDGPLTSRLQHLQPGDKILVGRKPVGTLILSNLRPGKTLWLLSTGTGLAPFLSLIREPEAYDQYERVVVVHGVRQVDELAHRALIEEELKEHEFLGEVIGDKLLYYPTVTREPFRNQGRVTDLITSDKITGDLGLPPISPEHDRVMLCGSPEMLADCRKILEGRGFREGSQHEPGEFVIEKAFVEK